MGDGHAPWYKCKRRNLQTERLRVVESSVNAVSPRDSGSASLAGHRLPAVVQRVLIIGLDGATFDVIGPLMDEGWMPRLREAVRGGASGILCSTTPPITPAAWTTFLTGKQPGSHGILDFERYDPPTNTLRFNSTRTLEHVRNLWQILGDEGLRIGSVNVPMTYPASPVNGFLISGFETPDVAGDFVYPPELRERILTQWPDPTLRASWKRRALGGDGVFAANLDYICRSFDQGAAMTKFCGDQFGWDVLMVVLKLIDNLQHKTWKYIDPRWSNRNPARRDLVKEAFGRADRAVGELLDYAGRHRAAVLIVSDHGHGSLEGKVQPNLMLQRWGYLTLRGGGAQSATRARYLWARARGKTRKFSRDGDLARDLAVDFARTTACVTHAGMAGFLYLNLEGRQPGGIVKPSDYERIRDDLTSRFLGEECCATAPDGRRVGLFSEVHKPEELYRVRREDQPWLPDLMLTPRDGLAVVRRIRGGRVVRWLSLRNIEGTHRPEGILIATGPGIARKQSLRAHLVDCAPTLLAMLGLRIPEDMEGRVVTELFENPPVIERAAPARAVTIHATGDAYTAGELEQVTARLSDLGYLE